MRSPDDSFELPNGDVVRAIGNNILVRLDDLPTQSKGGILFPDKVTAEITNTGVVVAVGYLTTDKAEEHTPIPGIKKGDRVTFVRYQSVVDTNQQIQKVVGDGIIRLRPADVLLIFDDADLAAVRGG